VTIQQQHQAASTVSAGPGEGSAEAQAAPAQTAPHVSALAYRDGITVEIPTRAGLVTVEFTGRDRGRASAAAGAYTYRGRQYSGTVLLSGPRWTGTAGLGWSLYPGGQPAGPGTAGTIAAMIAADVAAWLRDRPEILDQAGQARERAKQERARRDLGLLEQEIAAARQQLDDLFRRRDRLRVAAGSADDDPPGGSIWEYVRLDPQAAARFVVHTAQLRMDGEGTDGDGEPWAMENDDAYDTVHLLIGDARSLLGWQACKPPLGTDDYRTAAGQADSGQGGEGGAR
jgi:hypothetical protein